MRTTRARLGVAVAVGLLLTGCSGGGEQEVSEGPAGSSTASSAASSSTTPASGGGRVEEPAADVLVEQTVSRPESPQDEVTIGVESLTVEGDTTVLRLVLTPRFASVDEGEPVTLGEAFGVGSLFFGVSLRLLDRENLKEYSVINEPNQWWASASGDVSSANGEPMRAFAVFAAPEDDIDSIDVRVDEQWPEFLDVPISR